MQLIRRITLEAREDRMFRPRILETHCWSDWDTDSEIWAFWLIAPFVTLWYYLDATDWSKRNATANEYRLRGTPLLMRERTLAEHAMAMIDWELKGKDEAWWKYLLRK